MAHYALIDPASNIVIRVIVGREEADLGAAGEICDWEQYYGNFHNCLCRRTSYNTYANTHSLGKDPFRKNFACIGYSWDAARDAFIPPRPYPSWTLDENTCHWYPPIPYPTDGKSYVWNESNTTWEEVVTHD